MNAAFQPQLRLVGGDEQSRARWRRERAAAHAVAAENRAAHAGPLAHADPRWVLAARAYAQLQGPVLTPERREAVMRTARALGVRPFDASVIIAIVQDHARTGRDLADAGATLALLPPVQPRAAARSAWARWLGALTVAAGATALLAWWLTAN
jgi:hypothetical protein